jgi:pilus assembly protein CpaC
VVFKKQDAERARAIIAAMGKEVPVVELITVADPAKRQVVVHLTVLSLTRGGAQRLGVDWGQLMVQDNNYVFGGQPVMMRVQGGVNTFSELVANVQALATDDQAQILAQPNLVMNDGERAELVVGGEVPIPVPSTGATGGATVAIEYKQYGVVLKLQATIQADGKSLLMDMEPEVSSVDYATQVSISGFTVPGFRTSKVKTKVNMPDGGTLLLGGLIQHEQSKSVSAIPFISKLPIIGELFKNTEFTNKTSELVILVTPEIVQNTPE